MGGSLQGDQPQLLLDSGEVGRESEANSPTRDLHQRISAMILYEMDPHDQCSFNAHLLPSFVSE
jgi:hypothetical protein